MKSITTGVLKKGLGLAAGAALAFGATQASAAELVQNGGFQTGTFVGWTQSNNVGFTGVSSTAGNASTFGAFLGPVGSIGTLTQMLNTVAGQTYTISFDLRNLQSSPTNFFQVLFGGVQIYAQGAGGFPSAYTTFSGFTGTSTGAQTALVFNFRQDPSFYYLDNVSVQGLAAVPEPATWMMLLLGFGLVGSVMRSRRRRVSAFA
jgi:PEP-CTERM motif